MSEIIKNVYPEDIVSVLSYNAKTTTEENKQLEDALYWLKAAAENDLNSDYFRTLYNTLARLPFMPKEGKQ